VLISLIAPTKSMEAFQHNAGAIKKGRPNRCIGAGLRYVPLFVANRRSGRLS
jgi:hypothetical protein